MAALPAETGDGRFTGKEAALRRVATLVARVRIHDNGRGGANFADGTGLLGLRDRAEALGGHLQLHSPPGAGTTLEVTLLLRDLTEPDETPPAPLLPAPTTPSA
jgi:hypothetical protein